MTVDSAAGVPPVPGARQRVDRGRVDAAWDRLAGDLDPLAAAGNLVLLAVLMGGAVPLVQISQRLRNNVQLDACRVTRYGMATRGGDLRWLAGPAVDLRDRDVVIVDDVYDEGWTLHFVAGRCRELHARSVRLAVLVRKRHPRATAPLVPDFVGLELGDEYLFGCGMDYQGRWRHLPEIYGLPDA